MPKENSLNQEKIFGLINRNPPSYIPEFPLPTITCLTNKNPVPINKTSNL